jgi:hypothetical protein
METSSNLYQDAESDNAWDGVRRLAEKQASFRREPTEKETKQYDPPKFPNIRSLSPFTEL